MNVARSRKVYSAYGSSHMINKKGGVRMEEKYTIREVIEALLNMDEEAICAIRYRDKESLADILTDCLG